MNMADLEANNNVMEKNMKRTYRGGKQAKRANDMYNRTSNWKKWLLALIAVIVVLAIALGVGLGVGLKNNRRTDNDG